MSNIPDSTEHEGQELEQVRSRRGLFKWMGQISAGIALAGLGLGLTKPAFAEPNCYVFCTGCKILSCVPNGNCAHSGQGSYLITYSVYVGCEPNCSTPNQYTTCSFSCGCPCSSCH